MQTPEPDLDSMDYDSAEEWCVDFAIIELSDMHGLPPTAVLISLRPTVADDF
jgi:hypothetical protein